MLPIIWDEVKCVLLPFNPVDLYTYFFKQHSYFHQSVAKVGQFQLHLWSDNTNSQRSTVGLIDTGQFNIPLTIFNNNPKIFLLQATKQLNITFIQLPQIFWEQETKPTYLIMFFFWSGEVMR